MKAPQSRRRAPPSRFGVLRMLGPGLVTGAADDDPSGIATYSQTGAQFGLSMLWALPFGLPLLAAIQLLCARIGLVTGRGIADNLRRHFPRPVLRVAVLLLLVANIINIGADLGAMGAALALLVGGPTHLYAVAFALLCVILEVWVSYGRYAPILKWLTVSLFAYIGVVLVVDVPWGAVAHSLVTPRLVLDPAHATMLVAVLGTTISPYLFFWQAEQEVEEAHLAHRGPLRLTPGSAGAQLSRIGWDTAIGIGLSNLVAMAIIIATAVTLNAHGVTDIATSAEAAQALRPVAGDYAFALFAAGIIGTGLLAVPVLAGSAAYAVAETYRWAASLEKRPAEAPAFYTVLAVATLAGLAMNFTGLDPIKALYWAAVVNGILSAPLIALVIIIAGSGRIMGRLKAPWWLLGLAGVGLVVMAAATLGFVLF